MAARFMWKILKTQYVLDSPHMRIRRETVQLPDGTIYDEYFVREFKGWVAIFAVTTDGKILLTKQYKHGIREVVIELPAGGIDEQETPETAVRRELEEETGFTAHSVEFLGKFILEPTACDGHTYIYYAKDVTPTGKKLSDPKETIEILEVPLDHLKPMLRDGSINVISQIGIIHTVLQAKGL